MGNGLARVGGVKPGSVKANGGARLAKGFRTMDSFESKTTSRHFCSHRCHVHWRQRLRSHQMGYRDWEEGLCALPLSIGMQQIVILRSGTQAISARTFFPAAVTALNVEDTLKRPLGPLSWWHCTLCQAS